jgi:hypothetical protein
MSLNKETVNIQDSLALFCRNGIEPIIPLSRPENLHHYRRLVFNVVLNTMTHAFPIAHKAFGNKKFTDLVHDFFLNHDSQTPQVWKLPFEFYEYVVANKHQEKFAMPFLNDLLLFEWIEIGVHTMPNIIPSNFQNEGNMFTDILIVNQEYKILKLNYPVHLYAPNKAKDLVGNYYLIALRNPENFNVKFLNLSILHVYFIEQLSIEEQTINEIINKASEIFNLEKNLLITNITPFLNDMFLQKLILGYKKH